MVSEKQAQANIQNAQFSTGPVTPEGKSAVSRNAVKHGIFSNDLVISTGDGQEDGLEYSALLTELQRNLSPVGQMELLLVEKIAVNYWRLRRLVRFETGKIRERLDDFKEVSLQNYYERQLSSRQRPTMRYYSYGEEISDLEYKEQRSRVISLHNPHLDMATDKATLEYVFWCRLNRTEVALIEDDYNTVRKYVENLSPQMQGKLRKEMLAEAEVVLAEMEEARSWWVKFDRILRASSLPFEKDLNNVIKYENSLERSIFRNLSALKTLQENRKDDDDILQLPDNSV